MRSTTLDLLPALSHLKALPVDQRDKRYCAIEQLRPGATRLHTPIRFLLFLSLIEQRYSTVYPLGPAATLQALIEHCISSVRREYSAHVSQEQLFAQLAMLAEQAQGYRLLVARGDTCAHHLICSLLTRRHNANA